MSHSLTKIWIHLIFGSKERRPLIKPSFEITLHEYLKQLMKNDFSCKVKIINGTTDHLHVLFLQNQNYPIADIAKNIKGNSSHWINQNQFISTRFAWQSGYGAFSVSESMIKEVEAYIANQKEHHKKLSFS